MTLLKSDACREVNRLGQSFKEIHQLAEPPRRISRLAPCGFATDSPPSTTAIAVPLLMIIPKPSLADRIQHALPRHGRVSYVILQTSCPFCGHRFWLQSRSPLQCIIFNSSVIQVCTACSGTARQSLDGRSRKQSGLKIPFISTIFADAKRQFLEPCDNGREWLIFRSALTMLDASLTLFHKHSSNGQCIRSLTMES